MSGIRIPELDHSYKLVLDMKGTPVTIVPTQEGVLRIETDQPLRLEFPESEDESSILYREIDAIDPPPYDYVPIPPTLGVTGVTLYVSGPHVLIRHDEHQEVIADKSALGREKIDLMYLEY